MVLFALALFLVGGVGSCGGALGDPPSGQTDASPEPDADRPEAGPDAATASDVDDDGIDDLVDNCLTLANAGQLDGDGDGTGDACDCEPANAAVAAELVIADDFGADRGIIAPAPGFPSASWLFGRGYEQQRLEDDAADAAFVALATPLTDVRVRVTAASVDTRSFDTDDLRQLFVTVRGSSSAATYAAIGCGIEVDENLADERQTSIMLLGGSPVAPTSTAASRVERDRLDEDEDFEIVLDLRGSQMSCAVTIDNETTVAIATDLPISAGSVGFFTRESQSRFANVQVCSYRTAEN